MASVFEFREVVGISSKNMEAAIQEGLTEVSGKYEVAWFEVVSIRGRMVDENTTEYQVTLKIGCRPR